MIRKGIIYFLMVGFAFSFLSLFQSAKAAEPVVYVVPLENSVERGLQAFLERAIEDAEDAGAEAIVFDINTPGGEVFAADEISRAIQGTDLETIAYVNPNAISAGAFISMSADRIYMSPDGRMGSAAVIDGAGNAADDKAQSAWRALMVTAAEANDRNPVIAEGMVDKSVDVTSFGLPADQLVTLTANEALSVGYSEGTVSSIDEAVAEAGFANAELRSIEPTFLEKLARFITDPVVVPIILSIAFLGLIIELFSPGFGIPGTVGLSALGLFFFGHLIAGLAGFEVILLFTLGIGLIIAEFFLPGGIAGIAGIIAIFASILLAGASIVATGIALSIAVLVAVIGMVVMVKFFGKNMHLLKKIILSDSTNTESGYVSNVNRVELIGQTGVTRTALRPSGTIVIADERIDAVTEGGYIDKDKNVKVIKVEGSRIVVREVD